MNYDQKSNFKEMPEMLGTRHEEPSKGLHTDGRNARRTTTKTLQSEANRNDSEEE